MRRSSMPFALWLAAFLSALASDAKPTIEESDRVLVFDPEVAAETGASPSALASDEKQATDAFDRVFVLALDPENAARMGARPSSTLAYTPEFIGTLHAWTLSRDLHLRLRVNDGEQDFFAGGEIANGGQASHLALAVEPLHPISIEVSSPCEGECGAFELHLVAACESDATRTALDHAREMLADVERLRSEGALPRARASLAAILDDLDSVAGGEASGIVARACEEVANAADSIAAVAVSANAWRHVRHQRERTLPPDDRDLQTARGKLGVALYSQGDLRGARDLFAQVFEVFARTLRDDHPELQSARQNLAAAIKALGDLRGARELEEKVLEVRTRTLDPIDRDLQRARLNLATTLVFQGDLHRARELEQRALAVFERTLAAEDPELQGARGNLAATIKSLGDLQGARELQERALEVLARTLPDDHPDLQGARQNLALTVEALGDLHASRELEERVLEVRSRVLPADHPDLQAARMNLAVTIGALGDLQGARALEEMVIEVRSRTLADDHPGLQAARLNLADLEAPRRLGRGARTRGEGRRRLFADAARRSSRSLARAFEPRAHTACSR